MYNFPPVFHQTIHFLRCCWRGVIRILEQLSQVYLSHTNFSHCSHHISFHNITFHNISFHNISPYNPISKSSINIQYNFAICTNTLSNLEKYRRRAGSIFCLCDGAKDWRCLNWLDPLWAFVLEDTRVIWKYVKKTLCHMEIRNLFTTYKYFTNVCKYNV